MFFVDLVFAFLAALLLSLLFTAGFRRPADWANFLIFFVVVFLAAWAGGVWLTPFGPAVWGVYWLPFLLVALVIALILAALVPNRPPRSRRQAELQAEEAAEAETALSVFFWILMVVLLIGIIVHYV